jgi:2-polyprenyl-3-methyl-5-hydroxy-6-metoxy-1,4-benzoquinol methylase
MNSMSEQSITQKSRKFYEKYQFPGNRPIDHDGLILMRKLYQSIAALSGINNKIHVLDAGCGTGNTSISLAKQFREIEFVGLDQSKTSLKKAVANSKKNNLSNLIFRNHNMVKPFPYHKKFDLALCLGVLHHTADMKKVLRNLNSALKDNGELFLWIYAKHGRYNHSLNMRLLKMLLDVKPAPQNILELAADFAAKTEQGTPLIDLIGKIKIGPMQLNAFKDPVWIADQFLNPHEILIDMEELLDLVKSAGFKISYVLGMEDQISQKFNSPELSQRFLKLSRDNKLIAYDLLMKPERYFVVLQKLKRRIK